MTGRQGAISKPEMGGPWSHNRRRLSHSHGGGGGVEYAWGFKKQEPRDWRKASHQRGTPSARLGCGGCGVHVAEEPLDLPQGDTPASVTHLGDEGQVRCPPKLSAPLLTLHPCPPPTHTP